MNNSEDQLHTIMGEEEYMNVNGPKLCKDCRTANVCSILTTLLRCYAMGIILQVDSCPYYNKEKNDRRRESS